MKRLLALAVVALLASGGDSRATAGVHAHRTVKAIAAARERAAAREAKVLLRRFVTPRGATRLAHPPSLPVNAWAGSAPTAKFAYRTAYWRSSAPLNVVAAFIQTHPPRGLKMEQSGNGPQFRLIEFAAGRTCYIEVTVLRHAGTTFVRAQADVVWIYPRSSQEKVPASTTEIDVKGPEVSRTVTDPAKVADIVRWFDALPVSPPGVALMCPAILGPRVQFVFRSANGARLASASGRMPGKAWICSPISFSIHEKQQTALVDSPRGPGFIYRVGKLLGVKLLETRR